MTNLAQDPSCLDRHECSLMTGVTNGRHGMRRCAKFSCSSTVPASDFVRMHLPKVADSDSPGEDEELLRACGPSSEDALLRFRLMPRAGVACGAGEALPTKLSREGPVTSSISESLKYSTSWPQSVLLPTVIASSFPLLLTDQSLPDSPTCRRRTPRSASISSSE